jgi:hypothetical protein
MIKRFVAADAGHLTLIVVPASAYVATVWLPGHQFPVTRPVFHGILFSY